MPEQEILEKFRQLVNLIKPIFKVIECENIPIVYAFYYADKRSEEKTVTIHAIEDRIIVMKTRPIIYSQFGLPSLLRENINWDIQEEHRHEIYNWWRVRNWVYEEIQKVYIKKIDLREILRFILE